MINLKIAKNRGQIYFFLITALVFGIIGGSLSFFLVKTYAYNDYMNFWGEINLRNQNLNGTSLIIQGAKKVVIEQDEKFKEIMASTEKSLLALYEKKTMLADNSININNFYNLKNPEHQGTAITSDGWLLLNSLPENKPDKLIAIDIDNNFYSSDKIIQDPLTKFYFLHLDKVKNLPVRPLASADMMEVGKTVYLQNFENKIFTAKISALNLKSNLLKSSVLDENNFNLISLDAVISDEFINSTVFDLEGNIIGFISGKKEIIPAYVFNSALNSILNSSKILRPKLGIKYLDLNEWASQSDVLPKYGALIYSEDSSAAIEKEGAADKAGLKAGDLILGLDNINLNDKTNLSQALSTFSAGQLIRLSFWRNGENLSADLRLGEF